MELKGHYFRPKLNVDQFVTTSPSFNRIEATIETSFVRMQPNNEKDINHDDKVSSKLKTMKSKTIRPHNSSNSTNRLPKNQKMLRKGEPLQFLRAPPEKPRRKLNQRLLYL